jgi:hypothetical protein
MAPISNPSSSTSEVKSAAPIKIASFLAMLTFMLACIWSSQNNISQLYFIIALYSAIFLELISIGAMLELALASVAKYASFRWGFAAVLAFVTFFAKAQAMADLNSIFHIDPAALPMTLLAGVTMRFASYLFWPMASIAAFSFLALIIMKCGPVLQGKSEIEKISMASNGLFALVTSLMALGIIHFQLSDEGIKGKLYRLAHDSDFVSKFDCNGFDSKYLDALFIGPDQRKALFARKLSSEFVLNVDQEPPELLKSVDIPKDFVIAECIPSIKTMPQ